MNYFFFFSLHAILTIIVENRLQRDVLRDRWIIQLRWTGFNELINNTRIVVRVYLGCKIKVGTESQF